MDKTYIKGIIQTALNSEFSSINRRKINEFHDRLNFCCPYCGDGKSEFKKRGNIWFNKLIYVCFNCGKKTNLDRLSKDFNIRLDPDKKMEMIEHLNSQISYDDMEDDMYNQNFDKIIDLSELERIFNDNEHVITNFEPVSNNKFVYQYLLSRGIEPSLHKNIYAGKYWINTDRYENVMVLLNMRNNKVLGAQIRNLKSGKGRFFKIYNFETLYKWVKGVEDIEDIEMPELILYNKLSYYFNILNIDFSKKITVFEGYLDSLFYVNSIGVVGVNTNMNFLENKNLEIQYFYDNDKAGYKKSEEKIRNGYPVFLWKKLFQDIVDKKKSDDPYKLLHRISKVKDLNKLSELVPNPYQKLKLESYFSKDIMDIGWLPKTYYKYQKT